MAGRWFLWIATPDAAKKTVGDHPVIAVDVSDEAAVIRAFGEVRKILGGLDALAAIAGIYDTTPVLRDHRRKVPAHP